ncbi:hypothetical protein [Solilutibacter pythonis]|nr:hypothetical protein [Lysobacter pythonis]
MSKFDDIASRAAGMASEMGGKAADFAADLGNRAGQFKGKLPDAALKWVETGAALAAVRGGGRIATRFVRRNPALVVATAAGAGLLWYAARRRAKQRAAEAPIEGSARRIQKQQAEETGAE